MFVSPAIGYWFLFGFAIIITLFTYYFARRQGWHTKEGFLLANRKVGWFLGGFSIASSWIWAPALLPFHASCVIATSRPPG
jgi:Na+/proline symporter